MVISFQKLYMLLLIPAALLFVWYTSKKLRNMYKLRRQLITFCRSLFLILMILALAGMSFRWSVDTVTTIFVADASDSMQGDRLYIEDFVKQSIRDKSSKDQIGVVSFGDNAQIESFVSKDTVFGKIESDPNGMYTNIEEALNTAISLMPQNSKKRIVLITDEQENSGSSAKLAATLLEQDIELKIHKLQHDINNEAAVESIVVPQHLRIGEQFNIIVNINSKVKTGAKLTLISGREKVADQRIELQKGSNRFVFRDTADVGGFKSYRAVLEPDVDTDNRNNEASTFTSVLDKPRVLVLEDIAGEADEVERILQASGIEYDKAEAYYAPSTLEELSKYKSIILANVSSENLNEGFLKSVESYVRDLGGGMIATGGENSFALGGYFKTPLEKVLPVNMELKGKKEIPDMAIVLVIDKSGSMTEGRGGITKLDIAKEAAARTLDSLREKDTIGVLTFDDTVYWVVEPKKAADPEAIRDDIGTIRPGGGTSIIPALEEGYNAISKVDAKIKHIILLTDGQAERTGYEALIEKMNKENITASTVAVGEGSDTTLLESIAKGANGRFYYTDDGANIPRIFAKETFMAARAYLNNREFTPVLTNQHNIIADVSSNGLPSLLGYIAATPKSTARMLLASDQEDPILTVWQYGLGKTIAWNSDISGKWSANYVSWSDNIKLWQNMINWTIEKYESDNLAAEVIQQGGKGVINVTAEGEVEQLETTAVVVAPDMGNEEIPLYPTVPGQYSGSFDIKDQGAYLIKILQKKNGETVGAASTGISIQYSPEYKLDQKSDNVERLAKEVGAIYIEKPEDVYKGKIKDIFGVVDITPFLLILAILVFLIDIALRRLNLPLNKLEDKLLLLKSKLFPEKKKPSMHTIKPKKEVKQEAVKAPEPKEQTEQPKAKAAKPKEPPKADSLDTSALLKKKKNRE
ncbi:MAG: putative rane protein [Clostridia bacterium]|nr:putative rane protein [Clostridia bacterium]